VATNRIDLADRIKTLKDQNKIYFDLSDLSAVLARSQLSNYDKILLRRVEIADQYFRLLPNEITHSLFELKEKSIFFRFPLRWIEDIPRTINWFNCKGIQVRRGVDELLHRITGQEDKAFPNAVKAFETTLSIPIMPQLTKEEIKYIADQIIIYLENGKI
jgi:dTDP-4-amino-4,6-dideoxygalactose transaminase